MKALATLSLTGLLLAGALVPAAAAENGSAQPSTIERLVRQEDARGTVGASPPAPSQPTAIERLVRQEDARGTVGASPPAPSQPTAIERLVRQEDARGTVGASPSAPSQPTAIERLVRQEDARRNDLALGITRATQVISVPTPPRIEVVARDGFDWRDAAIGAASAIALVAAFGCATLVVRALTLRHGITLMAVASVATVVGAGVGATAGTPPWRSALDARSEALNEKHGLGVERQVLDAPGPGWLDALHARSDAMNRHYGLGHYARESARANAAPDWMTALNARSDALNRQYGLGEYAKG